MLRRVGTHVGQNVAGVRQIITSCTILRRHHEDLLTSFAEQTQALNEEFAEVFGEQAVELDGSMKPISSGQGQFSPEQNVGDAKGSSRSGEHEIPNGPVIPPPPLPPPPLPPPPPPPPSSPPPSYTNHAHPHNHTQAQAYAQHHAHQYPHVHPHYMYHQHSPGTVDPLNAHELRQLHEAIERVEAKLDILLQKSKK